MAIGDLFEGGEDRFIAASRGGPRDLWLFIHLPKTAGSSLQSQFAASLRPARNIHLDYSRPRTSYAADFNRAVDDFLEAAQTRRFRFASGHIDMSMAYRIREALAPVHIITMLRNPATRMVSEYRYQRTPAHPLHEEFKQRFPRIEDFVREERLQNAVFRRLAQEGESVADTVARMDRDLAFVGTLETYDYCLDLLNQISGAELKPEVVVRRTEDGDNRVEVTPELEQEILELNALDLELWRTFQDRLVATRDRRGLSALDEAGRESPAPG
jgi:hypothetical protein